MVVTSRASSESHLTTLDEHVKLEKLPSNWRPFQQDSPQRSYNPENFLPEYSIPNSKKRTTMTQASEATGKDVECSRPDNDPATQNVSSAPRPRQRYNPTPSQSHGRRRGRGFEGTVASTAGERQLKYLPRPQGGNDNEREYRGHLDDKRCQGRLTRNSVPGKCPFCEKGYIVEKAGDRPWRHITDFREDRRMKSVVYLD